MHFIVSILSLEPQLQFNSTVHFFFFAFKTQSSVPQSCETPNRWKKPKKIQNVTQETEFLKAQLNENECKQECKF